MTQISDKRLDSMMEAMQRVEQDLRDYEWMTKKAEEYKEMLKNMPKELQEEIGINISQYGIEGSLPKAKKISDSTYREAKKLLRLWERAKRYEKKLSKIDQAVASLTDERERAVAEGMMDGERLYMIAQQLNVSRQTVYELKKSTIRKLALKLYGDKFTA